MIDSVLNFIQSNYQYAWLIIFIVALLESVAIVGLFVPGWALLVGAGTLIGADVLSFYPIAFAAYLGAVIGEYVSYIAGYHYHEQIAEFKLVKKHQHLLEKSKVFFEKHGVAGVFIGRFFGPTRAVVPLIAGISEMKKSQFFWVNSISGLLWAPLYLMPGILVGAATQLQEDQVLPFLVASGTVGVASMLTINNTRKNWRRFKKEKPQSVYFEVLCWWSITILMVYIFSSSVYFDMLLQIFSVLLTKL